MYMNNFYLKIGSTGKFIFYICIYIYIYVINGKNFKVGNVTDLVPKGAHARGYALQLKIKHC